MSGGIGAPIQGVFPRNPAAGAALLNLPIDVVRDYGAKGDGATDDSSAFTSAINAAVGQGRPLHVPQPSVAYMMQGVVIPSYLEMYGDGPDKTIVKLVAGSTQDVFITQNFASLTGTNSNGGVAGVIIRDLCIDGNKANAGSGGWGIQRYGYRWIMENVEVRNCHAGGIYTEWGTTSGTGADGGFMEDSWDNIRAHDNGGIGIQHRGPHDSRISRVLSYDNGSNGLTAEASANYTATALVIDTIHVYTNGSHGLVFSTSVIASHVESEGSTGDGIQILANDCAITDFDVFNNSGSGLTVGAAGNAISGLTATGKCITNSGAQVNVVNDSGQNRLLVNAFRTSGQTGVSGAVAASSTLLYVEAIQSGANSITWYGNPQWKSFVSFLSGALVSGNPLQLQQSVGSTNLDAITAIFEAAGSVSATAVQHVISLRNTNQIANQTLDLLHYLYDGATFFNIWGARYNGGSPYWTAYAPMIGTQGSAVGQSATAVAIATSGTIATAKTGLSRVAPAAAATGVILQAGTFPGQKVTVVNEATSANSVTFAAAASNVADGSSDVITGGTAREFVWDTGTSLWYRLQ